MFVHVYEVDLADCIDVFSIYIARHLDRIRLSSF